jgi:hypothetical protein
LAILGAGNLRGMVKALAILFAVCVIMLQASLAGWVADRKGRSFWLYFAASLLVGPLALVGALLLPRRRLGSPRAGAVGAPTDDQRL